MPRDSNGNYSLPSGYLAEAGTTIQPSQHNPPLEDIASALTGSMPRSGVAPMTGAFKAIDGSVTNPGIQFVGGGGLYRTTDGVGVSLGGAKVGEFVAGGYTGNAVDLTVSGHLEAIGADYMKLPVGTTAQRPADEDLAAGQFRLNSTTGLLEVYSNSQWNPVSFGFLQPFQCQLVKDSTNLRLNRHAGRYVFINGTPQEIPEAGVALSPSGLIANTSYFNYVYMNSGTMTLEASTTAPATDSTYGHKIKTGDATRTLVGQGRTNGSIAWVDSDTQRFVRSYYNDPGIVLLNKFSTNRVRGSLTFVEIDSEIRIEWLAWADDIDVLAATGSFYTANSGDWGGTAIGIDGITPETPQNFAGTIDTRDTTISITVQKTGMAAGYHYATLLGYVTASAATYKSTTALTCSARRPS